MPPACAATSRECPSSTMAMARMRRACLASAVRAASARNCEILKPWGVISTADMLPAPRINDMLHRVTFAAVWESPQESGSRARGISGLSQEGDPESSGVNGYYDFYYRQFVLPPQGVAVFEVRVRIFHD